VIIALMLATDQASDAGAVEGLARASLNRGHTVRFFLLGDGVREVDLGVRLAAAGADVSLCEADAAMRGMHKSSQPGVFFGSLYDWARVSEDADRVMSFA
jgi:sulfur relay (sulfurtransferase) complex TusBCD TusD component (DsrE family)